MSGGIMQLVAYGAQDMYLTGQPQITFFKMIYRRHTNFSMESVEQTFTGAVDFGRKVTCTVSRNGDLIHKAYLQVTLPEVTVPQGEGNRFRWLNWLGHVMIKNVEVEIGGSRIDKHYGEWLHIWNELTQKPGLAAGYAAMVGNVPRLTQMYRARANASVTVPTYTMYIPLQFWWNRHAGLALPLIALQFHDVKLNIEFRELRNCMYYEGTAPTIPTLPSASLWIDYIYLDALERKRFAQVSHEYLIETLQFTGDESITNSNNRLRLNFNHPCKALYWVVQPESNVAASVEGGPQWFNFTDAVDNTFYTGTPANPYGGGLTGTDGDAALPLFDSSGGIGGSVTSVSAITGTVGAEWGNILNAQGNPLFDSGYNPVAVAKLQINSHDRFAERAGDYFNLVQPYQHHTRVPATGINMYSFALKPEEHQPSGSINMSRIDTATLHLTLTSAAAQGACKVKIFALSYNVLRVISGMAGLAYAN